MVTVNILWTFSAIRRKNIFPGVLKPETESNDSVAKHYQNLPWFAGSNILASTGQREGLLEIFLEELLSCRFGTSKALFLQPHREHRRKPSFSVPRAWVDCSPIKAYLPSHNEACNLIEGGSNRPGLSRQSFCLLPRAQQQFVWVYLFYLAPSPPQQEEKKKKKRRWPQACRSSAPLCFSWC